MQSAQAAQHQIGSPRFTTLLNRAAIVVAVGLLGLIALRFRAYQWDFNMFYWSTEDFLRGQSPYKGQGLSFYHPPLTLYLYRLFLFLPRPVAYELWFGLKLAALATLLVTWRRHFERLQPDWLTILYFVFAFNGALYADLVAGNVSLFEQLGLWLGFLALLRGQYARFCLCVILVAQFKLTPIFFSVLLLFVPERPQWRWLAVCVVGFVALFSLNYLLQPELTAQFFKSASGLEEGIDTGNASTLTLFRDVLDRARGAGFAASSHLDELAYLAVVGAVGVVSLVTALRYRAVANRDPRLLIYFACLLFTLIAPRMKVYSYILLLPHLPDTPRHLTCPAPACPPRPPPPSGDPLRRPRPPRWMRAWHRLPSSVLPHHRHSRASLPDPRSPPRPHSHVHPSTSFLPVRTGRASGCVHPRLVPPPPLRQPPPRRTPRRSSAPAAPVPRGYRVGHSRLEAPPPARIIADFGPGSRLRLPLHHAPPLPRRCMKAGGRRIAPRDFTRRIIPHAPTSGRSATAPRNRTDRRTPRYGCQRRRRGFQRQ
jgi:hypothetical protein